ncbi:roadblock/LC7 domain-containing protein [Undibacterium curvum]|uniref:Roadblock/LC7 domain-containing protein n=1 Tax=Undibacterium curvum TaxID=2762294 RepID=A0ABR7A554_9BURK|nr:roadblock/LC7 domain-containing protein [Undibacterium curvum]MBC3932042.1 roadblock/LC7 domain-containing protein [Undibacterium curvum]
MQNKESLLSDAKAAIDLVLAEVRSVKAVVISTGDGFEVAARVEDATQITRMSAMASSLSALGALAGEENGLGNCKNMIIESESGMLVILQVQRGADTFILSVIAGSDAVVGQILFFAKQAVRILQIA